MRGKGQRFKEKEKKRRGVLITILEIFFILLMIISGVMIVLWKIDNENNKKILEEIAKVVVIDETKPQDDKERYKIDFEELKKINPDVIGWIKVNGVDVEFPVVQAKNNNYYITHSLDKSYNRAGWIFADYKNKFDGTDRNIIIYGHNRKDGSMFAPLKEVLKPEWYNNEDNRIILFVTENKKYSCEIFSIYKIENEEYYIQTEFNDSSFKKFITTIKNRSIVDFNIDVNVENQILTLSTCDDNNDYRIVIHAKIEEEIEENQEENMEENKGEEI